MKIKKKQLKTCILASASMLLVIFACTEDVWQGDGKSSTTSSKHKNEQLKVSVAQQWFESNYTPVLATRSSKGRERLIKPYWDKGKESNNKRYEVVETPILSRGGRIAVDRITNQNWQPGQKSKFIRNTTKMVVMRDKKTEEIRSFIMEFIGSYEYLKKTQTMGRNSYLYRESDFDGSVMFYEVDGTFINGWKYTDGKIVATISKSFIEKVRELNAPLTRGFSYECWTETITNYYEECTTTYWAVETEYGTDYYSDEDCWSYPETEYYDYCEWVWDGSDDDDDPPGGIDPPTTGNNNDPDKKYSELQKELNKILAELEILIKKLGGSLEGITISVVTEMCVVNAKATKDGKIIICQQFFDYNRQDQSYIIWHELYHINNDKEVEHEKTYRFYEPYRLNPPEEIRQHINNYFEWSYKGFSDDDMIRQIIYEGLIEVDYLNSPDWYRNEIAAYEAEKANCTDPSDHYNSEREIMYWRHQECLRLAEIHNK